MRFYHNFIIIYRKIQKMSIVLGGQFLLIIIVIVKIFYIL